MSQARYDHAAELQNSQPPARQLAYLVTELGRWAQLNPGLVSLYAEFSRVSGLLQDPAPEEQP